MHPSIRRFDQSWSQCNCQEDLGTAAGFIAGAVAGGLFWAALFAFLCLAELFQ